MREIEFRGQRMDDQWVYGYYVQRGQYASIYDSQGEMHIVKRETIGQYIGLNDANDGRIYEDDTMREPNINPESDGEYTYYKVRFGKMVDTRYGWYLDGYRAAMSKEVFEELELVT